MAINSWIGIANAIGFNMKSKGGYIPPEDMCSLAYDDNTIILFDNGDSIAVRCSKTKVNNEENTINKLNIK